MKRRRHSSRQITLHECLERGAVRQRCAALYLPLELFAHEVPRHLGRDLEARLALALTCRTLYASPWRQHVREYTIEDRCLDEETDTWENAPSQRLFNVFAPWIETLTYYLPCHHGF